MRDQIIGLSPEQVRRARRAGMAQGACSSQQKHQVIAREVSKQRISQEIGGDHTSISAKFCEMVHALATHPKTDPAPLVLEPLIVYREARAERLIPAALLDGFNRKLARHAEFRAASDIALQEAFRLERDLPELLRAFRRDTWLRISLLADGEALLTHGLNPFAR